MFELSHRLIGIYKTSNATKSEIHLSRGVIIWLTMSLEGISINNHALRAKPENVA